MITVGYLKEQLNKFDDDSFLRAELGEIIILSNIPNNINGELAGYIQAMNTDMDDINDGITKVYTDKDRLK